MSPSPSPQHQHHEPCLTSCQYLPNGQKSNCSVMAPTNWLPAEEPEEPPSSVPITAKKRYPVPGRASSQDREENICAWEPSRNRGGNQKQEVHGGKQVRDMPHEKSATLAASIITRQNSHSLSTLTRVASRGWWCRDPNGLPSLPPSKADPKPIAPPAPPTVTYAFAHRSLPSGIPAANNRSRVHLSKNEPKTSIKLSARNSLALTRSTVPRCRGAISVQAVLMPRQERYYHTFRYKWLPFLNQHQKNPFEFSKSRRGCVTNCQHACKATYHWCRTCTRRSYTQSPARDFWQPSWKGSEGRCIEQQHRGWEGRREVFAAYGFSANTQALRTKMPPL